VADCEDRIAAIAAKLRGTDGRLMSHTPVPEERLLEFERVEGIVIPAELRAFASIIGLGGSGPGTRLHTIDAWTSALFDEEPGLVAAECLLDPRRGFGDYDDARDPAQGTVAIASEGAGAPYTLLVTSGADRNHLARYVMETSASEWIERAVPFGAATFLDWYEGWLDCVLAGSWPAFYGSGLIGKEQDLLHALMDAALPTHARRRALTGLASARTLDPTTIAAIHDVFAGAEATLRAAAVPLLVPIDSLECVIAERALKDPDVEVRRAVVTGLRRSSSPRARDLLVRALDDSDDLVATDALMALRETDALDDTALARLYARPALRQHVVSILGRFATERSLETLRMGLTDTSIHVRRIAAFSLGSTGAAAAVPALRSARDCEQDPSVAKAIDISLSKLERPA
jgi:hypothetical protein